jgi:hypothetical protein
MGATPFDPSVQELIKVSLGSNLLLRAPAAIFEHKPRSNRDSHLIRSTRATVSMLQSTTPFPALPAAQPAEEM